MLDDYVNDLKANLAQRREREQRLLNAGTERDDRVRGRLEAYEESLLAIDELMAAYREPESVPEPIQRVERSSHGSGHGHRFGSRRVA